MSVQQRRRCLGSQRLATGMAPGIADTPLAAVVEGLHGYCRCRRLPLAVAVAAGLLAASPDLAGTDAVETT